MPKERADGGGGGVREDGGSGSKKKIGLFYGNTETAVFPRIPQHCSPSKHKEGTGNNNGEYERSGAEKDSPATAGCA